MKRLLFFLFVATAVADPPTMTPPVRGTREMVAAANNLEVEAGIRLLNAGGNAVDGGVATVLAAAVVEQSRFGLGGEIPILIKVGNQPPVAISGIGAAPAKATVDYFKTRPMEPWERPGKMPPIPSEGIRAAIVPGVFDGLITSLRKYGTKSFAEVVQPAIELTEGFPIAEEFASMLKGYAPILSLWPASKQFYYPDGRIPSRGDIVKMPELEKTLKELVAVEKRTHGSRDKKLEAVRDYFYKGSIAKRISKFCEDNDGLLRYDDLAKFHADVDKPRSTTFMGYEVYKPGFWTQGPVMLEALNILEGYDLRAMGLNSVDYIHTVIEAIKLAFADRDRYYGDPKFSSIPEQILLSKEYAAQRRKLIDPTHGSIEWRPGDFGHSIDMKSTPKTGAIINDTTCVNVVDHNGNMFSATPSGAWLPSVIAGDTGIPLTTRLQSFVVTPGHPNMLQPGKRPRVTLSPTLVMKDGKPFMVLSTPGGDNQDQALLQVLLAVIVFGKGAQEAVEIPRFESEHLFASFDNHEFSPGKVVIENRIPQQVISMLAQRGHLISMTGPWGNMASPTVIIKRDDGVLDGGADPRRARYVFGR